MKTGIEQAVAMMPAHSKAAAVAQLASYCGVSATAVWNWLRHKGIPRTEHASVVSTLTGIPVSELAPPKAAPPEEP